MTHPADEALPPLPKPLYTIAWSEENVGVDLQTRYAGAGKSND